MITLRESEIRSESLALAVDAYQIVSLLPADVNAEVRSQLIDDSFQVSACIAESFNAINNEQSAIAIATAIERLVRLKLLLEELVPSDGALSALNTFQHQTEELYVELTELLAGLNLINADVYLPKLEMACI